MFQHLASLNATAAAPFPPERTAWLVTLPLIVIDHAQGQGYMYGPKPTPGSGGRWRGDNRVQQHHVRDQVGRWLPHGVCRGHAGACNQDELVRNGSYFNVH